MANIDDDIWDATLAELLSLKMVVAGLLEQTAKQSRWALADLRGVNFDPIDDFNTWIAGTTQQLVEEATRSRVSEALWVALRNDDRPAVPRLPGGS
jgi:hypothetical protein